jgi:biotin-(acetyl-CoA carboxylase) ligase
MKNKLKLKWINDVCYDGYKIAGILIKKEDLTGSNGYSRLIISCGVNINNCPISPSICLKDILGKEVDIIDFREKLTENIIVNYKKLIKNDQLETKNILDTVEKSLMFKGEVVNIWDEKLEKILYNGKFIRINEFGNAILMCRNAKGEVKMKKGGKDFLGIWENGEILKEFSD